MFPLLSHVSVKIGKIVWLYITFINFMWSSYYELQTFIQRWKIYDVTHLHLT